jgi:hypothetical protein
LLYQIYFTENFVTYCFPVRYYAIATPSATQRLLFGLLEAPPSWAPDALDAAVQLVELLRAAEDYASGMRVCHNFLFERDNVKLPHMAIISHFWVWVLIF